MREIRRTKGEKEDQKSVMVEIDLERGEKDPLENMSQAFVNHEDKERVIK